MLLLLLSTVESGGVSPDLDGDLLLRILAGHFKVLLELSPLRTVVRSLSTIVRPLGLVTWPLT